VDVTQRLVRKLIEADVELDREVLTRTAARLLGDEAPLATADEARRAVDHIVGLGPLEDLLRDPGVSDVLVNGGGDVWIERNGVLEPTDVGFEGPDAVRAAVERVISPLGLRLDRASPAVDARLPDGSRLHAALPPIAVDGPVVAVRRFTAAVRDLDELVAVGGVAAAGADLLRREVVSRSNLLVAGGTGTGKTTLLNLLVGEIPATERVVTVEDAAELQPAGHMVRLEARPANSEGAGEIGLRELMRHALRLRPDRIIVGEVRGAEALDMIQAMSTGHDGSMSTVHAGAAEEALWRLETLALTGDRPVAELTVRRQLRAAVDVIVQVERHHGGRRVGRIVRVTDDGLTEEYRCS
jgi:pilus assembly protein CpaF